MQTFTLAFLLLFVSGDEKPVYQALDRGDVTALERYDTKKVLKAIREGRPVSKAKTGQFRLEVEDGFGRSSDVIVRVPRK